MKHITSKLLSLLLTLAMLLSMVPAAYAAVDEESDGESEPTSYVMVGGINGFEDRKFETFEAAYTAIKPTVETLGLGQETPANAEAFDAVFTDVTDGIATLTYIISGNVIYDETNLDHLLTMGRSSSHYLTNERHLINFKFVGADTNRGATLEVNSDITLPYEWWGENTTTSISFENLTITGSAPSGLYTYQKFFEGIDFSVNDCTLSGIKIYNCANVGGSYCITNSTLDGTGAAANAYAIHLQGNETAPLSITISGNNISGYDRGINIDQATADATISGNTISVNDTNRSCIQLTKLAETTVTNNTLILTGGNAITLHENLPAGSKINFTGNAVSGTGYLIYDNTRNEIALTYGENNVAETVDTTKGVYGGATKDVSDAVSKAVNGDTTEPAGVAEVGGTGYATLAEAIRAANTGDTVTLLDNIELTSAQSINKQLTLDLNGKTIDSTAQYTLKLVAGADLTVKDSAAGGKIANTNSRDAQTIYLSAANTTFTLESGTIESTPNVTSIYSVAIANATKKACTVNINGGNVVTPEAAKDGRAIVAYNGMTLNISGGTITGGLHGVDAYSGSTVNITGGTISARYIDTGRIKEAYGMRINGTANITINGGEIQGIKMDDTGYNLDVPNVTLVSGNITGSFYSITNGTIVFTVAPTATITFVNDSVSKFLPSTVELVKNEDATYGVMKATAYVAKIADKGQYETLEAAFAEAEDGDTITLLSNCSGNGIVVPGKFGTNGLIIDFNHYTYTLTGETVGSSGTANQVMQLLQGSTITMKDGTINVDESAAERTKFIIQNYSNLTLSGMVLDGTNLKYNLKPNQFMYTLSTNNGVTKIQSTKIIAAQQDAFAFDVCCFDSYTSNSVELIDSTIEGNIEFSTYNDEPVKLKLTSGTVNGALVAGDNAEKVTVTKSDSVTLAAPTGYLWVAGDDSTLTLAKAVAQIGDKQYASLQAAFDEVKTGETVTLLDNITLTEQVNITKALNGLTLDGNGKTITCATTTDPFQSGGSALYFGNAGDKLYCTGIKIKDLTMTGTARFAIFLCGGTTTEFTNVNISGNYYIGINLYGTHGATMTNCNISNSTTGTDKYISAIWSNVSSANPLELVNTKVNTIAINAYTTDNKLEPKIYVKDGSEVGEIHTFDDGSVSGDKKLCVSPTSTGTYTIKEYDETNSEWIDIKDYVAEYNGTKYESLQEAIDAASQKSSGQTEVTLLTDVTITETVVFAKKYSDGSVLLNLGGYTLTGEGCRALQINKGNLYLENGTVTSTGIVNSSSVIRIGSNEDAYSGISPMLYMRNSAKVLAPVSYGVTIFGSATRGEKLKVMSNAEIIATGPSPAISGNGGANYNTDDRTSGWKAEEIIIGENAVISAANNYAIYHPECGTLSIQGGTISGKGGIQMCSGTLKISGSPTITAIGKAEFETGGSGPIYDIAAISAANRSYPGGAPVVTIKDTPTITTVDGENGEVIHAFSWDNTTKTESEWAEAGDCINVSGGTYNKTFNEAYLAEGCTLAAKDGMYTVEQTPVAEYNGTQYTSLAQAFTDARNSEAKATVKLLADVKVTTSLDISSPQGVTLDLDKKTLTLAGGAQLYTSKTATIKKGTIKRIDEPTSGNARDFAIQVMSGSTLLLGGTQAIQKVVLESQYGIYNVGGLLNVRYANITTDGWSIAVNDSASKTGSVVIGSIGTANITSQNGNCIGTAVNSKPNVTISKGTLTSNGTAWDAGVIYWASEGTLTITGGTFKASSAEGSTAAAVYQKNGTVKISGTTATLLGNNALVVQAGEGSTGTMVTELSGGKYSTEPDEAWVVEGKEVHIKDGLFVVEGEYVVEATLADGTIKSFDSWDKLAAVWNQTGATIKLLKDTSTAELVAPNGKLTIDFNGKTLTVTKASSSNARLEAAIVVQRGGELTLKDSVGNGGLTTTNVYGVEVITGSKLTIESGNYKCFTSAVQVDNGTAYIKGGTFQTEDTNKRYLLNCIDDAYQAGTAVMEVTGGTFYGFDPSAKPEGEGTTYVKVGYVVKGNDGVYTVEKSDKDAAMFDADGKLLGYEDVANAVNDPKAVTIKLIKNATANGVVLLGKTLDLNGFTLTTLYVAAFDKGNLIDSKEGEGLLKFTGTSSLSLCKDNSYLPLYDKSEQGYRFFSYRFKARGIAGSSADSRQFWFSIVFGSDKAYTLLKNAGHGLEIRLSLQVGTNDAMEAVVPQQAIASWVNAIKVNGGTYEADNAGFYMAVKGLSKIGDDTVTVTGIAKIKGVEVKSDGALTYPKTN